MRIKTTLKTFVQIRLAAIGKFYFRYTLECYCFEFQLNQVECLRTKTTL